MPLKCITFILFSDVTHWWPSAMFPHTNQSGIDLCVRGNAIFHYKRQVTSNECFHVT